MFLLTLMSVGAGAKLLKTGESCDLRDKNEIQHNCILKGQIHHFTLTTESFHFVHFYLIAVSCLHVKGAREKHLIKTLDMKQ